MTADLMQQAKQAAQQAYNPYSGFRVGAALLCADGSVVHGCNVENASYGLTICAERTALVAALAQGHKDFVALSIHVDGDEARHGAPCGACRQFIAELLPQDAMVSYWCHGKVVHRTVQEILPDAFLPNSLGVQGP